jgi:hypothetical protein
MAWRTSLAAASIVCLISISGTVSAAQEAAAPTIVAPEALKWNPTPFPNVTITVVAQARIARGRALNSMGPNCSRLKRERHEYLAKSGCKVAVPELRLGDRRTPIRRCIWGCMNVNCGLTWDEMLTRHAALRKSKTRYYKRSEDNPNSNQVLAKIGWNHA